MASLLDRQGRRKYLVPKERERLLCAALSCPRQTDSVLCQILLYTGCRVSEALNLTAADIDAENGTITLRTLKQREKSGEPASYRVIPLPKHLIKSLAKLGGDETGKLWNISRSTAWRQVGKIMDEAGISGIHASPKGLRHGFAVACVFAGVPVTLVSRWMGHKSLQTTMVYLDIVGAQERELASQTWPKS